MTALPFCDQRRPRRRPGRGLPQHQFLASAAPGALPGLRCRSPPVSKTTRTHHEEAQSHRRPVGGRPQGHAQRQSLEHRRHHRRVRAGRPAAGRRRDRRGARRLPQVVAGDDPAARRHPRPDRHRDHRPQGRARHPPLARRRQDQARRHRRSRACRRHLQVLRAGSAARAWPGRAIGAARHRCRSHARAGGRDRHDHAVELPHRHSRVEDRARARLRQLRGDQARGPRARMRLGAGRDHLAHRAARRACSTS